ncbi:type II secretion system protein [Actinophytocola sp.]|uniref:type II secretion system protein n=1 Tax=Actinophytocola sp. TaxID=1872138 RepID=UPI002EDAD334
MDTNSYLTFLLIGTLLVLVDGQIIYRNGRRFLQQSAPSASAESLTRLVSVLFHLVVLGVLALVSTIDVWTDKPVEGLVLRLGVVLIIIGIAHAVAITALTRIRDREEFDELAHEREARRLANEQANTAYGTRVPDPTESPAYNGESATSVVNRQQPYPRA